MGDLSAGGAGLTPVVRDPSASGLALVVRDLLLLARDPATVRADLPPRCGNVPRLVRVVQGHRQGCILGGDRAGFIVQQAVL